MMLKSFAGDVEHIILATDFRKQITSLSAMVTMQYHMDPFADGYVFIFCNHFDFSRNQDLTSKFQNVYNKTLGIPKDRRQQKC